MAGNPNPWAVLDMAHEWFRGTSGDTGCQGPTGFTVWKAALQNMTCGSWWTASWTWASNELFTQEGHQHPGLHQEEHHQQAKRLILVLCSGCLMGACKEDEARFLSLMPNDRTRGDNQKPLQEISLECRKNFSAVSVVKHWNRLPREVLKILPLEIFKSSTDNLQQSWQGGSELMDFGCLSWSLTNTASRLNKQCSNP